jgi:hypothetical protein
MNEYCFTTLELPAVKLLATKILSLSGLFFATCLMNFFHSVDTDGMGEGFRQSSAGGQDC